MICFEAFCRSSTSMVNKQYGISSLFQQMRATMLWLLYFHFWHLINDMNRCINSIYQLNNGINWIIHGIRRLSHCFNRCKNHIIRRMNGLGSGLGPGAAPPQRQPAPRPGDCPKPFIRRRMPWINRLMWLINQVRVLSIAWSSVVSYRSRCSVVSYSVVFS